MGISWDWIISLLILVWIFLTIAAAVTHQHVGDLLRDITEYISELRENAAERGEQLIYYDG